MTAASDTWGSLPAFVAASSLSSLLSLRESSALWLSDLSARDLSEVTTPCSHERQIVYALSM